MLFAELGSLDRPVCKSLERTTFKMCVLEPAAWALDAFSLNWAKLTGAYAFPPFAVIRDCLSKARREEASILLI